MDMYQSLAVQIMQQCPPGYHRAVLKAELDEGYAQIAITCSDDSKGDHRPDVDALSLVKLHDTLDDIREDMARGTGTKWTKCTFVIAEDGKFRMNVEY
jgi:hypothetical protein